MTYSVQSKIVFLFSLIVVLISLTSVVFPAFISVTVSTNSLENIGIDIIEQDPFQTSSLAGLLIISNVIIFAGYIFRNKFPKKVSESFKKIVSIKLSKKVTILTIVIILSIYTIVTIPEFEKDEEFADYIRMEERLNESIRDNRFTIEDVISGNTNYSLAEPHVKYSLLLISEKIFGDFRVVAFFASISLLVLTYLITDAITKNRFAGLVSLLLVIQSNLFLSFDTSAVYSNFWILFYLLSLYAIVKVWFSNPVLYVSSIFCKSITAMFAPMSIFFILNSEIKKSYKIILISVIVGILIIGAVMYGDLYNTNETEGLSWNDFWMGFSSFAIQMRLDTIIILFYY